MSKSDLKKRIKIFKDLILLTEGKLNANTPARKKFLEVHNGSINPSEKWEILFFEWKRAGQPDPENWFMSGNADFALINHFHKKREVRKNTKTLSVTKSKNLRQKKTQKEIEKGHDESGYNRKKIIFVQGGAVRPK